jgi:hypothetical protein
MMKEVPQRVVLQREMPRVVLQRVVLQREVLLREVLQLRVLMGASTRAVVPLSRCQVPCPSCRHRLQQTQGEVCA